MQLLAPDILNEARGLSPSVCLFAFLFGFFLWFFGWRWHRFWMGMSITIAGGLAGLQAARASGTNLLALGLLLAISSGVLALEISRILAFLSGGMISWMIAYHLMPFQQESWIAFLVGGLTGVILFRLWIMVLTSFIGVLFAWHAGLILIERYAKIDVMNWIEKEKMVVHIGMVVSTLLGLVMQATIERMHLKREKKKEAAEQEKIREEEREKILAELPIAPLLGAVQPASKSKGGFWSRIFGKAA